MSTRSSIFYWWKIHIYVEVLDDWVYLDIPGNYGHIFRLFPHKHWFLDRLIVRSSWRPQGFAGGKRGP